MTGSRIGCLAWGSLVWDPRTLPRAGSFLDDGPTLPIEFSRVAEDGRVTLVIDPKAGEVQTLWVPLEVRTLEEAVGCLGLREKIVYARRSEWVGRVTAKDRTQGSGAYSRVSGTIAVWMESHGLDAVVWTALPYRGPDGGATRPGFDRLLRHLESLEGEARVRAEEYIRRAPGSIRTAYRIQFEKRLGWAPISGRT